MIGRGEGKDKRRRQKAKGKRKNKNELLVLMPLRVFRVPIPTAADTCGLYSFPDQSPGSSSDQTSLLRG